METTILREAREEKGLSLRGAAKKLGIDHTRIFRHEKRHEILFPRDITRYAEFYDLEPGLIIDKSNMAALKQ